MLTLKRMRTLLTLYHLVLSLPPLLTMPLVLISFFTCSVTNTTTSTNSTSTGSGQNSNGSSGNTKNGALAGVVTNIGGLAAAVVLGVLAITL